MTDEANEITKLALVGDESIHGGAWQDWIPDRDVHTLTAPGQTSADLLDRHPDILDLRPDAVSVLVGTNDFTQRRSVEHVVRTVQLLLVTLRRLLPGTRMLVQSILPREADFADRIGDANRHLRQFAPSINAQYLDLWPALASADGGLAGKFADSSGQLNAGGYAVWLAELRPALDWLDEAPPMTAPITIIRPGSFHRAY